MAAWVIQISICSAVFHHLPVTD